jgi:uncharacterized protein YndB with AHSA1/START domain
VARQPRRDEGRRNRPAGRRRLAIPGGHPDGAEVGFHGEYREIVPNERIVSTEVYEGAPRADDGSEQGTVNTATFTEADDCTTLTILVEAPSKEIRDAIIESGMEAGMQDALDLLEQAAVSLR